MNSYFSVNDANKILPSVIKKFDHAKKIKIEVMKMEKQLSWRYICNFAGRIFHD